MIKIITSASYIEKEMAAEFGLLPSAFVPVGHQRLFEKQIEELDAIDGRTLLTIPDDYVISSFDQRKIDSYGVEVVRVPLGLTLGYSILYVIDCCNIYDDSICILHGDTLIQTCQTTDFVSITEKPNLYEWGWVNQFITDELDDDISDAILSGYFTFSDVNLFRKTLTLSRGDFLAALKSYSNVNKLSFGKLSNWLDFGHLHTYYRSRCSIRTQRSFNDLKMSFRIVEKSSSNLIKINSELNWFESIPPSLRIYAPASLGKGQTGYLLEYLPIPTLHELFVFGHLDSSVWSSIMRSCGRFFNDCLKFNSHLETEFPLKTLILDKTFDRLSTFESASGISINNQWSYDGHQLPSLLEIAKITLKYINFETKDYLGVMHGDFCFTNLFFDFRTNEIKVIDPRGSYIDGVNSVFGDVRYDIAKLSHSAIGFYDFILAGNYELVGFDSGDIHIEFPSGIKYMDDIEFLGFKLNDPEIVAIVIHLFLSMLPLHSDRVDRQKAFIANALRLFVLMESLS